MRHLFANWMSLGTAMLALTLTLGCAPADKPTPDKPATETEGAADEAEANSESAATEAPAEETIGGDATPAEDAATEAADEDNAAGKDPLDTSSEDPSIKLGEPEDPVNLK